MLETPFLLRPLLRLRPVARLSSSSLAECQCLFSPNNRLKTARLQDCLGPASLPCFSSALAKSGGGIRPFLVRQWEASHQSRQRKGGQRVCLVQRDPSGRNSGGSRVGRPGHEGSSGAAGQSRGTGESSGSNGRWARIAERNSTVSGDVCVAGWKIGRLETRMLEVGAREPSFFRVGMDRERG
jgi:hypothetical protein